MYDVVVEREGHWVTDMTTGSKRRAVQRARHIAHAWPWQRRMIVRIIGPRGVVDFNAEP
jgi:NhaP-type Na+/H+ or K+/H+ antiporter